MLLIIHGDYVKEYIYVYKIHKGMFKKETHCVFDSFPNGLRTNDEGGETFCRVSMRILAEILVPQGVL